VPTRAATDYLMQEWEHQGNHWLGNMMYIDFIRIKNTNSISAEVWHKYLKSGKAINEPPKGVMP
jgi:hypothetical protein